MNNHTHLPWVLKEFKNEFVIRGPDIRFPRSHSTDPLTDAKMKESERGLREIADARLITAAPELLEALEELLSVTEGLTMGQRAIAANARKVVAKAKGEI